MVIKNVGILVRIGNSNSESWFDNADFFRFYFG